jgi:Tfp pilus assembly protein PilF/O-antigen ligase
MLEKRSLLIHSFGRTVFALVATYTIALGGTFNGILNIPLQRASLFFLTIGVVLWGWVTWHRPLTRHHSRLFTSFDPVIAVWVVAFSISTAAHPSGRTHIGLWYAGLYIGVWFALADLQRHGIPARWIIDGILFVTVPLMLVAVVQMIPWFLAWFAQKSVNVIFAPPRPSSLLGNPNMLGTILAATLPFGIMRAWQATRQLDRIIWSLWTASALGVLYLTYSRGAWLASAASLSVLGTTVLYRSNRLTIPSWITWWRTQSRRTRWMLGMSSTVSGILLILLLVISLNAFNTPRRDTSFRFELYDIAWNTFLEHPVAGTGLFTFGLDVSQHESIPPDQPQAHAHNLVLNVAAELGLPGLIALLLTVGYITHTGWRTVRDGPQHVACWAGLVAFGVHSLFDLTIMVPGIMILMLGMLSSLVARPAEHNPIPQTKRPGWHYVLVGLLWVGLLITGWWSSAIYGEYTRGERLLIAEDYTAGADVLGHVADWQPSIALYHAEYGYARGLAAYYGHPSSLEPGIEAYERALRTEAPHAVWWINLAALYWQNSQPDQATQAIQQAVNYAPDDPDAWLNMGVYYELQGQTTQAGAAYRRVLEIQPQWGHSSFWTETVFRQQVIARYPVEPTAYMRAQELWQAGHLEQGVALLENTIQHDPAQPGPYYQIARLLVQDGDLDRAEDYLDAARLLVHTDDDMAWIRLVQAELARARGNEIGWQKHLRAARELVWPDKTGSLLFYGREIANFQFLRLTVKGTFLPQVITLRPDPVLVDLLRDYSSAAEF